MLFQKFGSIPSIMPHDTPPSVFLSTRLSATHASASYHFFQVADSIVSCIPISGSAPIFSYPTLVLHTVSYTIFLSRLLSVINITQSLFSFICFLKREESFLLLYWQCGSARLGIVDLDQFVCFQYESLRLTSKLELSCLFRRNSVSNLVLRSTRVKIHPE